MKRYVVGLGIEMAALVMVAALATGCATVARPVPAPMPVPQGPGAELRAAAEADCRALWRDELQRDIEPPELDDCGMQVALGRPLEEYRAQIRSGPEWAALHRPKLAPVALDGRWGLVADGAPVPWTALTGFQYVHLVATGRIPEAEAYLESLGPAVGFRALGMAMILFPLSPSDGLAALPTAFDLAAQHGRRMNLAIFADTKSYPGIDYRAHARAVAAICAEHRAGCALLSIANENAPTHSTQDPAISDLGLLRAIQDDIHAVAPGVPVSLGSTHGELDESDILRDGDYVAIHGNRDDGDNGWRWVRHTNEQRALADALRKWADNEEPRRDDLACDRQLGEALLTRLFSLGDTFHYAGGLNAKPPGGAEASAFACRARGWAAVPPDWRGSYQNAGWATSPVKGFSDAVRVYASVSGGTAWVLVLGAGPGLSMEWRDDWPHRERRLQEGGAQLWWVTR